MQCNGRLDYCKPLDLISYTPAPWLHPPLVIISQRWRNPGMMRLYWGAPLTQRQAPPSAHLNTNSFNVVLGHTALGGVEWIIETISGTLDICCHLSPPPVCWPGQGLPTMFGICHKPFFFTSPSIDLLWLSYLPLYLFDASWLNPRIWIWVKKIVELEIFPWLSNIM